ncbi:MAG: hypothetical protein KDB14_28360 [Planctomycetales bacterium]|nr:hypothetical protein [Planctomycetales bacterium]
MTQRSMILDRVGGLDAAEVDVYREGSPYQPFGISRRAWGGEPFVDFISKTGDHHAIAYTHLYDIAFNPSAGIVLQFSDHFVRIAGIGLADVYAQLLRQRVVFICEADHAAASIAEQGQTTVTRLSIEARAPQDMAHA